MKSQKQKGVAVVTALLLTTLAITIIASLFWQQQVQVRSIENQRFQLQKKWVLRGALDWASLILREDARTSAVDYLGEPWSVNLGETRLDQYVENGRADTEASEASLSGQISDAQAKFNLTNLSKYGVIDPVAQAIFAKLLLNLHMDPSLAQRAAQKIASTQPRVVVDSGAVSNPSVGGKPIVGASKPDGTKGGDVGPDPAQGGAPALTTDVQFLRFSQVEDLLDLPGFTADMVLKLKNYVTVLPVATKVNVNTTNAEVLSACLENVSMTDAALMIASRDRAYFLDFAKFKLNFQDKVTDAAANLIDVKTSYFVINGRVKLNRSLLEVNALIERDGPAQKTQILWIKEN